MSGTAAAAAAAPMGGADAAAGTFLTQGVDERGVTFRQPGHGDPSAAAGDGRAAAGGDAHGGGQVVASRESTRLHHKAKELARVDDQLAATKELFARRCEELKAREVEFLEKQADMIESIRKFKGFIVETDTKRHRALLKASDEHKTVLRQETAVAELKERLQALQRAQKLQSKRYRRLMPYKSYLEGVTHATDEFADVSELLTRHNILAETHDDLRHEAARLQQEVESTQADLQALLKSKQNEVLIGNSKMAQLQKTLEDESRRTATFENEIEATEGKAREAMCRYGQIHMAISNLYERVLQSRGHSWHGDPTSDTKSRIAFFTTALDEIAGRVLELQDITTMFL